MEAKLYKSMKLTHLKHNLIPIRRPFRAEQSGNARWLERHALGVPRSEVEWKERWPPTADGGAGEPEGREGIRN
ncbi:unnamed protein product [Plutella xylostella]|uniref:(diamondback moth) hypothetical protein n=1 Tax=Plutella xylostella TaxID=51655 RepID=A0A8S4E3V7_PLUXY|nr:unnamed protein product [Plutella xylostella]